MINPKSTAGVLLREHDNACAQHQEQPQQERKRRYAQGTALGEFGIIPMCDQVDEEPVKVPSDDLAHEIWAAAQTAPGEGIEDAVERVAAILARRVHHDVLPWDSAQHQEHHQQEHEAILMPRRNAELADKLVSGSVAVGSDGEWVSIRRHVRDEAVAALRAVLKHQPVVPQLRKFYGVSTDAELIAAQARHIERLQAKLPRNSSLAPQGAREG